MSEAGSAVLSCPGRPGVMLFSCWSWSRAAADTRGHVHGVRSCRLLLKARPTSCGSEPAVPCGACDIGGFVAAAAAAACGASAPSASAGAAPLSVCQVQAGAATALVSGMTYSSSASSTCCISACRCCCGVGPAPASTS
jgi:hypothetical protein